MIGGQKFIKENHADNLFNYPMTMKITGEDYTTVPMSIVFFMVLFVWKAIMTARRI